MTLRIGLFLIGLFCIQTRSNAAFFQLENAVKIHQVTLGLSWRHQQDISLTFAKSIGEPQEVIDSIRSIYQRKMIQLDSLKEAFSANGYVLRFDTFFIQRELGLVTIRFAENLERIEINRLSDYKHKYPHYHPQPLRYNEELIYLAPITICFLDECHTSPEDYSDQELVWIDFLISHYRPLQVNR